MSKKLSRSEAGLLGAIRTKEVWLERYRSDPKYCNHCGKQLPYEKRKNKFCDHSCAASNNNLGVARNTSRVDIAVVGNGVCNVIARQTCQGCGKDICDSKHKRKFCSVQCQRDLEWQIRKQQIIESGKALYPKTAKRYLTETQGHRCEICGIIEWQGEDLPMVLDHIDGNSDNNRLENLRLVCSNCDSQLPTYKNRNSGKGRHSRRQRYKEGKSY